MDKEIFSKRQQSKKTASLINHENIDRRLILFLNIINGCL